jgi:predicted ferric reductase
VATQAHAIATRPLASPEKRRSQAFALLLIGGVICNGLVLVWLWLRGGGVSAVGTAGALWTSMGRLTGLVGAYLALVQVLLLARLPPLERRVGFDRLTVWHRINGKLCLYLILGHTVLITLGYAAMDQVGVGGEFSRLLSSYPGMIAATVATGVMIALVISSIAIVRRQLPYEAWYAVHLTAYAAIALGYLHQIPTGNDFSAAPSQATWWITLYVVTVVVLITYRVARPIVRMRRHRLRVSEVVRESADTVSIVMRGRNISALRARPGQFLLWRFLTRGRWWQSHPFSLSAAPSGDTLRITVKAVGGYTAGLASIRPGTLVLAEGPFGRFVSDRRSRRRVTLIAGGIGVTPLRAMLEDIDAEPGEITFIHRVACEHDCVLRDEVELLGRRLGASVHHLIGDHREPRAAEYLTKDHLLKLVPGLADNDVFVCGPPPMMDFTQRNLIAAGVPAAQIHLERFALAA